LLPGEIFPASGHARFAGSAAVEKTAAADLFDTV